MEAPYDPATKNISPADQLVMDGEELTFVLRWLRDNHDTAPAHDIQYAREAADTFLLAVAGGLED